MIDTHHFLMWMIGGVFGLKSAYRIVLETRPSGRPLPPGTPNPWAHEIAWFEGTAESHYVDGNPRMTIIPPPP